MKLSQKCKYALRAVFAVAVRPPGALATISEIAEEQDIPRRFLGGILNQLRQDGILESRRGKRGGYALGRPAKKIRVGDIVRLMDGPILPVQCGDGAEPCRLRGDCVFLPVWQEASRALSAVYDRHTLADLVERHQRRSAAGVLNFTI